MIRNSRSWWRRWLDPFGSVSPSSRRRRFGVRCRRLLLEALEDRCVLAYVVTSTADSGTGSLRDAINQVNANPAVYSFQIDFDIASSGVQTITPFSTLPALTASGVTINGLTELGSALGAPLIQLNGSSAAGGFTGVSSGPVPGLIISGTNCEIEGLIINNFSADGIYVNSGASGTSIYSCFVGTNSNGTAAQGNGEEGIWVNSNNNQIGSSGANRNIISGNGLDGIFFAAGSGNLVLGNYIGTNAAGTAPLGNGDYGILDSGSNNTIGYALAGYGNVLSGNHYDGLFVGSGATGDSVLGNFIGTNAAGTAALANGAIGVVDDGSYNTIGGTATAARNIISGNGSDGVLLDPANSGDLVQGNYIGLNANGSALGNSGDGLVDDGINALLGGTVSGAANYVYDNVLDGILLGTGSTGNSVQGNNVENNTLNGIEDGGTGYNIIGGDSYTYHNFIVLNGQDGILIDSSSSSDIVDGNSIGTDTSGAALGNGGNGIENAGARTYIGEDWRDGVVYRNLIAANAQDGILLDQSATGAFVLGNSIGINNAGTRAVGNALNGIEVLGSSNSIGATTTGARNIISGNANNGILLGSSASANLVQSNFVGTNAAGTAALANSGNGIEVLGSSNTIGGTNTNSRNIVSGNNQNGILLGGSGTNNLVQSSFIGLSVAGTAAVANGGEGIEIAQSNDTIGGTVFAARNVISGNAQDGVLIHSGFSGTLVQDDFVGTNLSGTAAIGNAANGIEVFGVNNTIGGASSGQHNLVSGNLFNGILLDSDATGNTVLGNYVGTNNAATAALDNSSNGVEVDGVNNTVGGTTSGARNVISGNFNDGVYIAYGASGVAVQGNFIGTTNAGNAALPNGTGVEVQANAATIGGSAVAARNIISGNTGDGVDIDSGVSGAVVQGNYIGINDGANGALGNGGYGVNIAGSATLVGGTAVPSANIIAYNATGGVNISAGSGNSVRYNSIYANGPSKAGPGIVLVAGANNNIVAPTINTATLSGTTLTVTGTFTAPTANVPYVLEFFVSPAGDPEGKIYVGKRTVIPGSTGTISFTFKVSTTAATSTTLITATLTDASGDTSAFSNGVTS